MSSSTVVRVANSSAVAVVCRSSARATMSTPVSTMPVTGIVVSVAAAQSGSSTLSVLHATRIASGLWRSFMAARALSKMRTFRARSDRLL